MESKEIGKGLKRLRNMNASKERTPPTKGSITQRKKANKDEHRKQMGAKGEVKRPKLECRRIDFDKNCPKSGKMKFHRPGSHK